MERTVAVAGPRDADEAWEDYAVPACWPEWSPPIRAVDCDGDRLADGLSGTVVGPAGLRVPFVVTAVDEPRRSWEWEVRLGPVRVQMRHEIVPRPGGGCVATFTALGPALVVAAYPDVARLALARLVGQQGQRPGA